VTGSREKRARRALLRPLEAALILQLSEDQILHRIRAGKLRDVSPSRWARLDPDEVREKAEQLIAADRLSPLAVWVWEEIVESWVPVPRTARGVRPPSQLDFLAAARQR